MRMEYCLLAEKWSGGQRASRSLASSSESREHGYGGALEAAYP